MQVNAKLRKNENGYAHFCPACQEMHTLFSSWNFNGNLDKPSFTPSFSHKGLKRIFKDGHWTGEWERTPNGDPIEFICHYILTDGILNYCGDCTHPLAGLRVELPDLPEFYRD